MLGIVFDFLFPKKCYGCGEYGKDLCGKCFRELSIADQMCPECGEESPMGWTHEECKKKLGMDGLIVIYDYQDHLEILACFLQIQKIFLLNGFCIQRVNL